jgi:hypothetical protein
MCQETCGKCDEFFKDSEQCGHPMVYLNHSDNIHRTKADTEACGFYHPIKPAEQK